MNQRKSAARIILLLSSVYFVSYLTRNSYNVVIAQLVRDTGLGQSTLALCVTGSLVAYGAGQIVSGFFGDRFQPKALILMGLGVTMGMNLLMAFCRLPFLMLLVWCVNGLAQSFLWPPLVRLMAELFSGELYEKAVVAVTWGGSIGNIALYLAAPALIALLGVESVFIAAALCALGVAVLLSKSCPLVRSKPRESRPAEREAGERPKGPSLLKMPLIWAILLTIVLQGALRDGVTTWTPVYVDATYGLGSGFAILSGAALPLLSIASIQAASLLHRKWLHNPMVCSAALFGLGGAFGLLLAVFPAGGVGWSVGLCALLTGCMHGVNLILIGVLPAHFQRFGRVSLFSGILNAFTYIGSALSAYGFAAVADWAGWRTVIAAWPFIALIGAGVCLCCAKPWRRFDRE